MSQQISNDLRDLEYRFERLTELNRRLMLRSLALENDLNNENLDPPNSGDQVIVTCMGCLSLYSAGFPLAGATILIIDSNGFVWDSQVSDSNGVAIVTYPNDPTLTYTIEGFARGYAFPSPVFVPYGINITGATAVANFFATGGYCQAPSLTISPLSGTPSPSAFFSVSASGGGAIIGGDIIGRSYYLSSATVVNKGSGYSTAPTVTVGDNGIGDTGATASAYIGRVDSASVASGGTGYTNGSAITFPTTTGYGVVATGTINCTSGVITSVNITTKGAGYTATPTAVISGGGSGASITPNMVYGSIEAILIDGGIGGDPMVCVPGYGVTRLQTIVSSFGTINSILCAPNYRYFVCQQVSGNISPSGSGQYRVCFGFTGLNLYVSTRLITSGLPNAELPGTGAYTACAFPGMLGGAVFGAASMTVVSWNPFQATFDFTGTGADGPIFQTGSKVVTLYGT